MKKNYCITCGDKLATVRSRCQKCYDKWRYHLQKGPPKIDLNRIAENIKIENMWLNGITAREIALELGITVGAARSRISRLGLYGYGGRVERYFETVRHDVEHDIVNGMSWMEVREKHDLPESAITFLIAEHRELAIEASYKKRGESLRLYSKEEEQLIVEQVLKTSAYSTAHKTGIPRTTIESIMHRNGHKAVKRGKRWVYELTEMPE